MKTVMVSCRNAVWRRQIVRVEDLWPVTEQERVSRGAGVPARGRAEWMGTDSPEYHACSGHFYTL